VTTNALVGLDLDVLDAYLKSAGVPRNGPLRAALISGGRSNLTFEIRDADTAWVLRRPPMHGLTPSAHDMAREYRVVAALNPTPVPVAPAVALCEDESVLGAPFAIVEYVDGNVVRTRDQLEALGGRAEIDSCVDGLIGVLADLHRVDPASVGLGDFGRPQGYLERQVRRWGGQWQHVHEIQDPRDADVERLHSALVQQVPPESGVSIVHGDYRIDNTILDAQDPSVVRAVVDWEMSTLGDPLSDVALMCIYRDPAMDAIVKLEAAWTSPLLPSADELAQRYSTIAGRRLDHWSFYMALAYFKLAIIAAGVDYRDRLAAGGIEPDWSADVVAPLIAAGLTAIGSAD
jgi:aminoglycoside phosphotransferase (APT) family kinase protein